MTDGVGEHVRRDDEADARRASRDRDAGELAARRDNTLYLDAVEALRDDVREDIGHLRDDVREDIREVRGVVTEFIVKHGADHTAQRLESEAAHQRFDSFIKSTEIAQARKDGALGVFRFVLEHLSRNIRPIAAIAGACAVTIAALAGAIHIEVAIR
ncbi:MAG TPA: hypothetical protein VIU37_11280 [Candidatus Limnocylindrales bacterium]